MKVKKSKVKSQKGAGGKSGKSRAIDPLIWNIVIFLAVLIAADVFVILHFEKQAKKMKVSAVITPEPVKSRLADVVPEEYTNPEEGKMKTLKIGGEFDRKMPVFREKLKFKMTYDPVIAGANDLHVLEVCCFGGYTKEYYTSEMPWAFLLYEFEPGLPTVTLFEIDKNAKTGRFEIVILDKMADETTIKAVSVTIFTELLRQYLKGYEWNGSVRKEIM